MASVYTKIGSGKHREKLTLWTLKRNLIAHIHKWAVDCLLSVFMEIDCIIIFDCNKMTPAFLFG